MEWGGEGSETLWAIVFTSEKMLIEKGMYL